MAIRFDLGNGTNAYVQNNAHIMDTQRGIIAANEVVTGDHIKNVSDEPRNEVIGIVVT